MSEVEQMPLEIWTDINGNATRTQFTGGVKYIRADERDRLRRALRIAVFLEGPENVQSEYELWCELADNGLKEKFNEWYGERVLAALTPAGGGRNDGITEESTVL